jgi:hypothetical protein
MLRANVGISRKMSRDYNSQGFTLNLDSEIHASLDDPESVIERVRELYSLAEEALDRQIADSRSIDALAHRDHDSGPVTNGQANGHDRDGAADHPSPQPRNGKPDNKEPASNKQVQFVNTLARRRKLFGARLEAFIEEATGRRCSPYDLSRKEAGAVIEALQSEGAADNGNRR